jgi:hypothetical protein
MRIGLKLGAWTAALVVACHGSTAPPAFAGRYHLTAFNGAPVPASVTTGVQIESGSLELDAGGDWLLSRTYHVDASTGPPAVETLSGRWSASGSDITLFFASTSVVQGTATYAPGTVDVTYGGNRYTFLVN